MSSSVATLGVAEAVYVGGEHVASVTPRPARQQYPARPYGADEDMLIAAYEAAWERANAGHRAPRLTLEQWREGVR